MSKTLEYYIDLPYRIEYEELSKEDGGGVVLSMPELGRAVVTGCGDTLEEARKSLKEVQEDVLSMWIKTGVRIPLPDSINTYSGKLSLRISPQLHQAITEEAKRNQYSINQYITVTLEKELNYRTDYKYIMSRLFTDGSFSGLKKDHPETPSKGSKLCPAA